MGDMAFYSNYLLRYGLPSGILLFMLGALFFAFVRRGVGAVMMLAGLGLVVAYYVY